MMEENKLYRLQAVKDGLPKKQDEGEEVPFFCIYKGTKDVVWQQEDGKFPEGVTEYLVEYTPPTPLELEQLEEKVKDEIRYHQNDRDSYWWFKCWQYLKPLISSMLQERELKKYPLDTPPQ